LLVFAGSDDGIAPIASVRPLVDLVPRAEPVRFEIVPGGHLGLLTGRAARRTTWRILDEFLATMDDSTPVDTEAPDTEAPTPPSDPPLGTRRERRYSSAATREALGG
jgi:polyhydroxyalkanoate synthase subunit PhaC